MQNRDRIVKRNPRLPRGDPRRIESRSKVRAWQSTLRRGSISNGRSNHDAMFKTQPGVLA
jgi:hypothetical protein